jgi:metal-sulfur cluster biosynthetic enzyme
MNLAEQLHTYEAIIDCLEKVIDPETGANVVRMRLIDDLVVDPDGRVSYTFRPSSPLCPIAVFLVQQIKQAVAEVPGVKCQKITVTDYVAAEELTKLINQET